MADKLQAKIDEFKEQMPDELYRQLCNLTMEEFKKEESEEKFYELTIVSPHHYLDDDGMNNFAIKCKKVYKKLTSKEYKRILESMRNNEGICDGDIVIFNNNSYSHRKVIEDKVQMILSGESSIGSDDDEKKLSYLTVELSSAIINVTTA